MNGGAVLSGGERIRPLPAEPAIQAVCDVVPTLVQRPSNVMLWPDCDVIAGDTVSLVLSIGGTEVARADYTCDNDPAEGKMLRARAHLTVVELEIPPPEPEPVDPGTIVLPPVPEGPVVP